MDKLVKFLRQTMHLGALWLAVCVGLFGALAYTRNGLELLLADQLAPTPRAPQPAAAPAPPPAPAAPYPRVMPQPTRATAPLQRAQRQL